MANSQRCQAASKAIDKNVATLHIARVSRASRPDAYSAVQRQVGERIGWVRDLVIPNQAECARLIGVTPPTLNKIEKGTRAASIFNIITLANKLRVSTDFLLRGQLVGLDQEIERRLIALHPELVLQPPSPPQLEPPGPK